MRNRTYGGVRGRKTKVGRKLLRFPPTRLWCYDLNLVTTIMIIYGVELSMNCCRYRESDSSYEDQ